jgi:hypothetical protein
MGGKHVANANSSLKVVVYCGKVEQRRMNCKKPKQECVISVISSCVIRHDIVEFEANVNVLYIQENQENVAHQK